MKLNALAVEPGTGSSAASRSYPLSNSQTRIWFLEQYFSGQQQTTVALAWQVSGPLNIETLRCAVKTVLAQHELLRARFITRDGVPAYILAAVDETILDYVDLQTSEDPAVAKAVNVQQYAAQLLTKPFDLEQQAPVRVHLLRGQPNTHVLIVSAHPIALDRHALHTFVESIARHYVALAAGREAPSTRSPSFTDFVNWQYAWLQSREAADHLDYWRQHLRAPLPTLQLWTDRPRPPVVTFAAGVQQFAVAPKIVKALQASSSASDRLPVAVTAAFGILLHRYTGQTDLIIGVPVDGRLAPNSERLLGPLSDPLPLRIDLNGNPTANAVLEQVQHVQGEARRNAGIPLETIIDAVNPPRDSSRAALFQVLLDIEPERREPAFDDDLKLEELQLPVGTFGYDLCLRVRQKESSLQCQIDYNSDLFDAVTISKLVHHFESLLRELATNPVSPISELPMLSADERQQLLQDWNRTESEFPADTCCHELFEAQVQRTPDAIAVVDNTQSLTYAELNSRANRLAHYLQRLGVGPDVPVGIGMERSVDMAVALLGILKAGGCYLPLEPNYPPERIAYMLEHARPRALLTQQRFADIWPADLTPVCLDTAWQQIVAEPDTTPSTALHPQNLVYVIYTSGSTGRPKGVAITHRGLTNYLWWAIHEYAVADGGGSPVHSPLSFDLTVTSLWTPLLTGRKAVLLPDSAGEDGLITSLCIERNFSLVKLTPAHVTLLNQVLPADDLAGRSNALVIGGEALRGEMLTFWCKHAPKTRLINEYGPTETVVGCCTYEVPEGDFPTGDILIGRPNANCQLYVLDNRLNPVPAGIPGELYIGGTGLARGYLHRPDLTAERFVPSPFGIVGERLYKTGDLARYRPDGNLEYLGRVDHQVKVRGFRIELGEIEARMLEHGGVREAVVIVRDDLPAGKQLVAYAAPAGGFTSEDLRNHLQTCLPDYMVPMIIVPLPALPLNKNGKVERQCLPKPDLIAEARDHYVAPQTAEEKLLTPLWQDILGLPQVGIHDSFFRLGGHSLLAVRLVAAIEAKTGIKLPLAAVFQAPTIAELARLVGKRDYSSGWFSLVPIQAEGDRPTLFAIHTLSLKDLPKHLGHDQPLYFLRYGMADQVTDRPVPLPRLEDLATHYIEEMRRLQPKGPYYLMGASFGGLVAFEMARQLRAMNCEVALLAIFDTHLTVARELLPWQDILQNLKRQRFEDLTHRIRRKIATFRTQQHYGSDYWPHVYTAAPDVALAQAYQPQPYAGTITFFKAEQGWGSMIFRHAPPELAWQPYVQGEMHIHVVPGDHIGIIEEPYVRGLVAKLRECMDQLGRS